MTQFLMPIRGQKKETTTTVEATGNALSSHVLEGKTFSSSSGTGLTGTMKKNTATTNKLTVSTPDFVIPSGYHDGNGIVKIVPQSKNASPDIVEQVIKADSGNVLSAVTIAPVEGTAGANNVMEGYTFASAGGIDIEGTMKNYGGVNITPRMATASVTNIMDDKGNAEFGYYGSLTIPSPVTGYVNSSTKFNIGCYGLHPEVIKAGQLIGGDNAVDSEGNKVYGTYTSDATATADSILEGETAYVNGKKIEGTIEKVESGEIATIAGGSNGYVYINIPKTGFYYANDDLNIASTDLTITPSFEKQNYNVSDLDKLISSVTVEPMTVTGNATTLEVLNGKTFSNSSNIGLKGTMKNYGHNTMSSTNFSMFFSKDSSGELSVGYYVGIPSDGFYNNRSRLVVGHDQLAYGRTGLICLKKNIYLDFNDAYEQLESRNVSHDSYSVTYREELFNGPVTEHNKVIMKVSALDYIPTSGQYIIISFTGEGMVRKYNFHLLSDSSFVLNEPFTITLYNLRVVPDIDAGDEPLNICVTLEAHNIMQLNLNIDYMYFE